MFCQLCKHKQLIGMNDADYGQLLKAPHHMQPQYVMHGRHGKLAQCLSVIATFCPSPLQAQEKKRNKRLGRWAIITGASAWKQWQPGAKPRIGLQTNSESEQQQRSVDKLQRSSRVSDRCECAGQGTHLQETVLRPGQW